MNRYRNSGVVLFPLVEVAGLFGRYQLACLITLVRSKTTKISVALLKMSNSLTRIGFFPGHVPVTVLPLRI